MISDERLNEIEGYAKFLVSKRPMGGNIVWHEDAATHLLELIAGYRQLQRQNEILLEVINTKGWRPNFGTDPVRESPRTEQQTLKNVIVRLLREGYPDLFAHISKEAQEVVRLATRANEETCMSLSRRIGPP